jgi:RNA-directed DNA polymerase
MDNLLTDLFLAYYECRKNKKNTINAKKFELNYENNIFKLYDEIKNETYFPSRCIVFIIDKPVKREIFASDFRDRVIHHYIIKKLNPLFEKTFIYDSYACRKNKGTLFGVKRVYDFIKKCSNNYKDECFILKMDIEGFFMNINKKILHNILIEFIDKFYFDYDKKIILFCVKTILENDYKKNCYFKSNKSKWNELPKSKSLFGTPDHCGLPIGNLTSQIFANLYLNEFDKFIKNELKIEYYGRYVDDFVIIHKDKQFLKKIVGDIEGFLKTYLELKLHPKKLYLQNYKKGVGFLGTFIKPNRIYIKNNIKGNFFKKINEINSIIENKLSKNELEKIICSVNSYLGLMKNHKTFNLRKKMMSQIKNNHNYFLNIKNNKIIINKKP